MTSSPEERAKCVILKLRAEFDALDSEQFGYIKFGKIPVNDKSKEREIFDEIDSNKDGKISFDEYIEFLFFEFGWKMDNEVFDQCLWISLDRNKTGSIKFEEYRQFHIRRENYRKKHLSFRNNTIPVKSDRDLRLEFNKINTKKDGKMTFKELQKYLNENNI